jgi:hypothetical protein
MKLSLNHRVATQLLQLYYGLLEMDDYADMYEFIYSEDERDYELTIDQVADVVENYMTELKETIDEFARENRGK